MKEKVWDIKILDFNLDKYLKLKKRYEKALKNSEEQFVFEGDVFLTKYARYVLEYLEIKFNLKKEKR